MPLKGISREKIPWYPSIDADKCDGCRECLVFCPNGVYAWNSENNRPEVANPFLCTVGCNGCQPICPQKAISFPDLQEISAVIAKLRQEDNERS